MSSILNGAPHKLENIIQFHVGDMVTSLQRAVMQPGGQESIIYGTVMGGIGEHCPTSGRLPALGSLTVSLLSSLAFVGYAHENGQTFAVLPPACTIADWLCACKSDCWGCKG